MSTQTSEPDFMRTVTPTVPPQPPKKPIIHTGTVSLDEGSKSESKQGISATKKRSLLSRQGVSRGASSTQALKKCKPEHTIEDEGDDIAATALIGDEVVNLVTGDDEDESTRFILCLAAVGVVCAIAAYFLNKDNSGIMMGIYLYMGGYAVLLLRIMPFYLTIGGLAGVGAYLFGTATTPVLWISLIALGVAGLCYLIRYLIPQHIMRIIKKISWVLMFVGPGIMLAYGANITGPICMVVSVLWFILFVSHAVISKGMEKITEAAVDRITSRK